MPSVRVEHVAGVHNIRWRSRGSGWVRLRVATVKRGASGLVALASLIAWALTVRSGDELPAANDGRTPEATGQSRFTADAMRLLTRERDRMIKLANELLGVSDQLEDLD